MAAGSLDLPELSERAGPYSLGTAPRSVQPVCPDGVPAGYGGATEITVLLEAVVGREIVSLADAGNVGCCPCS